MLKYALLGMLAKQSHHGYELKARFEAAMGGTWPLNIGQIYSTLSRLERDGLVEVEGVVPQKAAPDRHVYSLTPAGAEALAQWIAEPSTEGVVLKDEMFVRALVCAFVPGSDPLQAVRQQRVAAFRILNELGELRADAESDITRLLLDGAMLHVEADVQWLDNWEQHIRANGPPRA